MQGSTRLFDAIFGKARRPNGEHAARISEDALVPDPDAEALNSLFHMFDLVAGKFVGFDQMDRSLKSCGWQDIASNALDERFARYSAFARLTRGNGATRLQSEPSDILAELERQKEAEKNHFQEGQHTGPIFKRFYSNRAIPSALVRLRGNEKDTFIRVSQLDATLRYTHRQRVLGVCKSDRIARHFVDYSQCSWKIEKFWPSGSWTAAGTQYYSGRDSMETWFVANVLSDDFRNSARWYSAHLPEVFLSISRNESSS